MKRKVVCVRWPGSGVLGGVYVETDEVGGGFGPFSNLFYVEPSPGEKLGSWGFSDDPPAEIEVERAVVDLTKRWDEIHRAVDRVRLEGLEVEKVTILTGAVAAHPPARHHHFCPFCHPPEE